MIRLSALLLCLLCLPLFAQAQEETYGLAMHGAPKYEASDENLTYANPEAPKGGHLKRAAIGTFDTLNPYTIKGRSAQGLGLVTDRLMARVWDEPFTMYPLIARSYNIAPDRSWIEFTLDSNARFHNSKRITVDDVIFSYETLRDFGRPNQRQIFKLVDTVTTGNNTIKFTFGEGYDQETALILAMMPVLSKDYWADKNFDETTLEAPLGSGPYKIKHVDAGRSITFERVKDYWAADHLTNKGLHNFDQITYNYFRDDGVALEAFNSGQTSLRREASLARWKNAYNTLAVKKGEIVRDIIPHARPEKARGFIFNTRRAPFDDIRVREALSLLLDSQWINQNLFYGDYKRINSIYPNSELSADNSSIRMLDRRESLRKAHNLLKDAGWNVENGKRMKEGEAFTFEILLGAPEDEKLALNYKRSIEKAGIEANIRVLDTAAYRGRLNEYDFDMTIYHWLSSLSPGTEQNLYWSCKAANQPARWNFPGICDVEVDSLSQAIAQAKTREELVSAAKSLDSQIIAGHYFIPLFYSGSDYFAYWQPIARPKETPIYGAVLETWWMNENGN